MVTTESSAASAAREAGPPAGLHPQALRVLALTGGGAGTEDTAPRDRGETAVAAARRAHIEMSPMLVGRLPRVASSISSHAPGTNNYPDVRVRISVPDNPRPGTVVYLHGGGWVIGTLDTFDGICRMLANHTQLTVVAVDYRLAPEHPYPAAIEDAESVLRWVASGGAGELAQSGPLVVAGDSAGGNLAASLCLRVRDDSSLPRISAQVLVYPITDTTMSTESMQRFGAGLYLTADAMQWYWACYLQGNRAGAEHHASVLHEPLADLPPALVITAEFDPLRDEGEAFAARLEEAGNAVTLRRFDGMIHGFFRFAGITDAAEEAAELVREFLANVLHHNHREHFLSSN